MKEVKDDIKKNEKYERRFWNKKIFKSNKCIVFKALIHDNKEYLKKTSKGGIKIEIEEIIILSKQNMGIKRRNNKKNIQKC